MARREMTVCIIADYEALRDSLSLLLQIQGFPTIAFSACEAFLAWLPADAALILILDLELPGMGGFELLEHLAARDWRFPTVLMTSLPAAKAQQRAGEMGVLALLEKPFDVALLHEALGRAAVF